MTNHPSSSELYNALLRPGDERAVRAHVETCLACRVRQARLAQTGDLKPPGLETVQTIIKASATVPSIIGLDSPSGGAEPKSGELWRIGRDEALLAWVRKNFGDGAVDVVPVVLDVELADEQTVIVPMVDSPFEVELGVMVALRTHVHRDSFVNRVAELNISADVEDVIAAMRAQRGSVAGVGPPIERDDDDRLEYRQALRDLLAELSPGAWAADPEPAEIGIAATSSSALQSPILSEVDIKIAITERLWSARCLPLDHERFSFGQGQELETLFKVIYLDTAVIVAGVASFDSASADVPQLAQACQRAVAAAPDVDAVCVASPVEDWITLLFSRASMRQALELPSGERAGAVPVLKGLRLVDTLWKHLDGAAPAWEVTENPPRGIGSANVVTIANRHAQQSIATIEAQGRRAHQALKKSTWSVLPAGLDEKVSQFVMAITQSVGIEDAFAELDQEWAP